MIVQSVNKDPHWQQRLEELGYGYHSIDGVTYWVEDYYYQFNNEQAEYLYKATQTLWDMCLQAVQHVIDHKLYEKFAIPMMWSHAIEQSWDQDAPSIYGRFDLAYNPNTDQLKLLEFNADTPTSLFESGIVQWNWKNHYFSEKTDQYNSIHEQLIESWSSLKSYLKGDTLYFTCVRESLEDLTNVEYLRDTAIQAGINTELIYIDDIGWNEMGFVDLNDVMIDSVFKLYPWEWMIHEEFGINIKNDPNKTQWIEPAWKMILSNKAILPILWELYPDHPLLLPAFFEKPAQLDKYVQKPILSREGANISLYYNNQMILDTPGEYGDEGFIYQALADLHRSEKGFTIIGSWIIGQEPCGISVRESDMPITTDKSRFVPHIIK